MGALLSVGHSERVLSYIQFWVAQKVRENLIDVPGSAPGLAWKAAEYRDGSTTHRVVRVDYRVFVTAAAIR